MACRRADGTLRAVFASREAAVAFSAVHPAYRGDVPVLCEHGCGWHLSAPHWPDAVAAAARMGTIGLLVAPDGSQRMVSPSNGVAFSHEEIALYCGGGHVLIEHERNADYQPDRPDLMTREKIQ